MVLHNTVSCPHKFLKGFFKLVYWRRNTYLRISKHSILCNTRKSTFDSTYINSEYIVQIIFKAANLKEIFSFYRSLIDIDVNYKIAQLKQNCKRKQILIIKGICININLYTKDNALKYWFEA